MFVKRFLLVFFVFLGCFQKASSQFLTPKTDSLLDAITKLTYDHKFTDAQTLVVTFLKQDNLTPVEVFYGHFLKADINKSAANPTKAIELLLDSKKYLIPIKNKAILESLVYGNISECYFNIPNYSKAKEYALLSIKTSPNKSLRGSGHAVNNLILGFSNYKEKEYAAAINSYQEAMKQYLLSGEPCELPLCYNKIAAVHWEQNHYQLAEEALEESFFISDSCDIDQYRLLSKLTLSNYYRYRKQYKKALELQDTISTLTTSIYNRKQQNLISTLEVKYETELTRKENENLKKNNQTQANSNSFNTMILSICIVGLLILLVLGFFMLRVRNQKNQLLREQLQKIETQNQEREALLKEIHHRVKNNLQVITSLLHLQANQNSSRSIQSLFKQSQHRINTMAMVHEMLYQSNNLSKIQLQVYLKELSHSLIQSIKGHKEQISTEFDISADIYLDLDTAIPLGLLCNEIISNSLIHGIPKEESGTIYIQVKALENASFVLYIGDNGLGCPKDLTLQNVRSLGLSLVRKLTRQLSGKIAKDGTKKGCHYIINFKEVE